MADLTFSSAPWKAGEQYGDVIDVEDAEGGTVAQVFCSKPDATLIASAPELLAALRAVDAAWSTDEDVDFPVDQVRAAIARAEGRP